MKLLSLVKPKIYKVNGNIMSKMYKTVRKFGSRFIEINTCITVFYNNFCTNNGTFMSFFKTLDT